MFVGTFRLLVGKKLFQFGIPFEALITFITGNAFQSSMFTSHYDLTICSVVAVFNVRVQIMFQTKRFTTIGAGKRFLSCMRLVVGIEMTLPLKRLRAKSAGKSPLIGVDG